MGKGYDHDLSAKLKLLAEYAFSGTSISEFGKKIEPDLFGNEAGKYFAVFIAVCDGRTRAQIFHASGLSLDEAMEKATEYAAGGVKKMNIEPKWIKLEIITHSEEIDPQDAVNQMFSSYNEFFRRGISLDPKYEYAYTEGEINGNRLLNYKEQVLDLRTFNAYSMKRDDDVILKTPRTLIIFDCASWFIDEKDRTYKLYDKGYPIGRREMGLITQKDVKKIVMSAMHYLCGQLHPDGSFNYGFYPISQRLIPKYNIMRHSSTIWSLVCSTEIEKNPEIYKGTQAAIKYMISQIEHYDDGTAYLVEKSANEIKLGGNGVAIITLSQYMKVYETDEYVKLCQELGRGILRMMNPDGTFAHVLNADTRELKDQFRTVYYDGEATFALCRLHSMTGSSLWLEAARRSVDHFIEANYTMHRDHWVAYAVNELTMYIKDEKYYRFALKNITDNLDLIRAQPTTYHTYLELLMAGYETYKRMVEEKVDFPELKSFDASRLADVIFARAEHMLNGYGYPEYVMYLPEPSKFKGSFFVRHDGFRVRIDDVQHFCGAYIAFYRYYDEIKALRSESD